MDHRSQAEQSLAFSDTQKALTHAVLALVDCLEQLSCLVAIPHGNDLTEIS